MSTFAVEKNIVKIYYFQQKIPFEKRACPGMEKIRFPFVRFTFFRNDFAGGKIRIFVI